VHLERDRLRVRFSTHAGADQEVWFWHRMSPLETHPVAIDLPIQDVDATSPALLRVHFRGWSRPPRRNGQADHQVELVLNGRRLGFTDWDNDVDGFLFEAALRPSALRSGPNRLELRVPRRVETGGSRAAVDVVLLNWIEVLYRRRPVPPVEPIRLEPTTDDCLAFEAGSEARLLLYDEAGGRVSLDVPRGGRGSIKWRPEGSIWVVPRGGWRSPAAITADRPSDLRARGHEADYLILSHSRLLEAVEPLAEFHRRRGLRVSVIDIEDVYDEFNHSIVHPEAIRDFLEHAYRAGGDAPPRYVLLVGDASWDPRNSEAVNENYADWTFQTRETDSFVKNTSTSYARGSRDNHRNLIPSWPHPTHQGHAATDHRFVDFGEGAPAMAIGRFPVVLPAEVTAIVTKTLRYAERPAEGDWRNRILWITNEQSGMQRLSDRLAGEFPGFSAEKIYPLPTEPSNADHRQRLLRAFDRGQLLVHFIGHGGRYIWRTGPPDLEKNHDLFTLEDLDELRAHSRLPVVLSMTCYSAPFDHPNADSIGEKLLRIRDRGAVAVVAASWRNSPTEETSRLLLEEFTKPGTIGEAFARAKRRSTNREFVYQYNLLGDPATPLAVPETARRSAL
jgi:hypothetical protein